MKMTFESGTLYQKNKILILPGINKIHHQNENDLEKKT
jgi:hypothetical protein